MNRRLFYSWQSDLPASITRNLIQDALERAAKAIARDESQWVRPVIDRDTAGLEGTPNIADSIFAKIASSDAFVADVTIVSAGAQRPTPNPNVLIELGYAVGKLGWKRVLLVQNTAFGAPDDLPFDLRGRRTVTYHAPDGADKAAVRAQLQQRLTPAINSIAGGQVMGTMPTGPDASVWRGTWSMESRDDGRSGTLTITDVCAGGFAFNLDVFNGAHAGQISGNACLVSHDIAYARVPEGYEGQDGEISFHRSNNDGRRIVRLEETASCLNWHGMRAHFEGEFTLERLPWLDAGLINELELGQLKRLLGSSFEAFRNSTSDVSEYEVTESGVVKALAGGLAGLYTIIETMAVFGDEGQLWCAHLDGEQVEYFASHPDKYGSMPRVMEVWRERFADKKVVNHSIPSY